MTRIVVMLSIFGVVLLAPLSVLPLPAWGGEPMALLLEKKGTLAPDLDAFSELPTGLKLFLLDSSSMEFLHYRTCETVGIAGGHVTITPAGYTTTGKITHRSRTPCPRKHTVRAAAGQSVETAGVRLRGHVSRPISLPQRPNVVLVGRQAGAFAAARIASEGSVVLEVPLQGRRLLWPDTADSLEAGGTYEMTLVPLPSDGEPIHLHIQVSAARPEGDQERLTLIDLSGGE